MIQFNYSGDTYISFEEKKHAKDLFIEKLGPFKDEFESKDGTVIINFNEPIDSMRYYGFNVGQNHSLWDFISRWNQYILSIR
jgi:hypothetical protein